MSVSNIPGCKIIIKIGITVFELPVCEAFYRINSFLHLKLQFQDYCYFEIPEKRAAEFVFVLTFGLRIINIWP